jgi:1,4-dihydroxy-2-naphthoate octaprenyltransferase
MASRNTSEPERSGFSNPLKLYFAATRPAFLIATLTACLLGLVGAAYSGVTFQLNTAILTILLALIMHAGVNVLNDYFDALNGTDAINNERLYPFTGGSRFIQNGLLTTSQTANFACLLLAISIFGGLYLAWLVGFGLLIIGAIGVLIGWAYSALPLRLNGRGLGEFCVLAGFLGVVVGADFVQRRVFSIQPVIVGVPYALLVTNLLYINQFPDRKADATAGKRHLVVMLPLKYSLLIYPLLAMLAGVWLYYFTANGYLPVQALLAAVPLIFSASAAWILCQFAARPAKLLPAIKLTLAAMLSHALLLTLVMIWKMP